MYTLRFYTTTEDVLFMLLDYFLPFPLPSAGIMRGKTLYMCKCFNEIQRSVINNIGCRHNCGSNQLKMLKNCCHHSIKDLHVDTVEAWWKMKKYSQEKVIVNYPDGCIICLKSFSAGCLSGVKKATQIVKIEGH